MATHSFAEAARRATHALVATLGGTAVQLLIATPPVAGDDGEELGLRSPQFQAETVAPAVIRHTTQATEVLLPADVLEAALGVEGSGAIKTALLTVTAIQIEDELYVTTDVQAVSAGGSDLLYRLELRVQGTEVV